MKNVLKIAVDASLKAGACILNYYKSEYKIKEKGYHNPVTTADHAANDKLKKVLLREFPDYGWFSEETLDSPERLEKEYVWIIDPLDGTKEFIEGVPHFVVSVALVKNKEPVIGVLYNPIKDELFTAEKGKGAFLNGKRIYCSFKDNVNEMIILNSRSETRRGLWKPYCNHFMELRPIGSVAYKLGLTAAGKADIFASLRPKNEWDICAGNCIINEAGGKLIDLSGNQRLYNQKNSLIESGLIAGNKDAVDKTFIILTS